MKSNDQSYYKTKVKYISKKYGSLKRQMRFDLLNIHHWQLSNLHMYSCDIENTTNFVLSVIINSNIIFQADNISIVSCSLFTIMSQLFFLIPNITPECPFSWQRCRVHIDDLSVFCLDCWYIFHLLAGRLKRLSLLQDEMMFQMFSSECY